MKRRRVALRLAIAALSAAVALGAAELALQAASHLSPRLAYRLERTHPRHLPDARLGHRPHPYYPDHDDRGFRNASVPSRTCLLALGDSMTYGHKVRRREAWPQVLAASAEIAVYNMAYGGWGPAHARLLLPDGLALRPRLVIYGLYTGNDLWDAYHLTYGLEELTGLRGSDPGLGAELAALPEPGFAPLPMVAERGPEHAAPRAWMAQHSALYGLLRSAKRGWAARRDRRRDPYFAHDWDAVLAAIEKNDRFTVFEHEGLRTVFTAGQRRFAVDRGDPRIAEGSRLAVELLAEMASGSADAGAGFAVLLIPTKEQVFCPEVERGREPELDRLCDLEAELLGDLAAELGSRRVPVIDALPALRQALVAGESPYPISANGHPNARGQRALAQAVSEALAARLPGALAGCREVRAAREAQ